MINFRYHIVSLAAVLLALAAGVALGAGTLDKDEETGASGGPRVDSAVQAFESAYADGTATQLVGSQLADRRVLLVTTPGARAVEVEDLIERVQVAGGTIVGEVSLTAKLLDASNRQFSESVAQQSAPDEPGVQSAGDSYGRIGTALARALVSADDAVVDETASTILAAFGEGGLIETPLAPEQRADLVLTVTGPATADGARGRIVAELTAALATAGNGAALVGPSVTSVDGAVLDEARNSDTAGSFATVDVTELAAGRVLAVLALVQSADGNNGSWGTTRSADGSLP